MCWTAGCPYEARVRRRAEGKWRNYCHSCDDKFHHAENARWCQEHSLDTAEKQKAYCRAQLKRGLVKQGPSREPGEDDGEVTS